MRREKDQSVRNGHLNEIPIRKNEKRGKLECTCLHAWNYRKVLFFYDGLRGMAALISV